MTDYDIHSCGYYCDRPACIERQRNELRDKLFEGQAVKTYSGGKPNYTQPEETQAGNLNAMKTELWKPEPDCYGDGNVYRGVRNKDSEAKTIYTESKAEWVGLTDDELEFYTEELGQGELGRGVLRAVDDFLKEKNNG